MASGWDPRSTVIVGERNFRLQGIFFAVLGGVALAVTPTSVHPGFVRHVPVVAVVAYLVVVGALTAWVCSRAWRIALRMDDLGITVRNLFLTHRFSWTEVRCFADGAFRGDSSTIHWALRVVPYDAHARRGAGRPVTATATARRRDEAEVMAVLRQAIERHGMAAGWTGEASGRPANRWYGVALIVLLLLVYWQW